MDFLKYELKQIQIQITKTGFKQVDDKLIHVNWDKQIQNNIYKIYIVRIENEIVYVGETRSALSSRFSSGFRASLNEEGTNGYHGYKWINDHKSNKQIINVNVFIFNNLEKSTELNNFFENLNIKPKDSRKTIIEAIEAEIVFNVRTKTDKWCKFQHEIHFHNLGDKIKEIACEIYCS
jgi:hypothetical protein